MAANQNSFITLANLQHYNNNLKEAFGLIGDEKFDEVRALIDASFKAIEYEEVKDDEGKITSRVLKFYRLTETEISEKRGAGETVNPDYEITLPGDVVIPDPINGTAEDKDKIVIAGSDGKTLAIGDKKISDLAVSMDNSTPGKYILYQGDIDTSNKIGEINIPTDLVVKSGTLIDKEVEVDGKTVTKKYLQLTLNAPAVADDPNSNIIEIDLHDLVDTYTGTDVTKGIKVTVSDYKISAELVGEIDLTNLPQDLQNQLNNTDVNTDIDGWF